MNEKIYYLTRVFWRSEKYIKGSIALPLVPLNHVSSYNPKLLRDEKKYGIMIQQYRISYGKNK